MASDSPNELASSWMSSPSVRLLGGIHSPTDGTRPDHPARGIDVERVGIRRGCRGAHCSRHEHVLGMPRVATPEYSRHQTTPPALTCIVCPVIWRLAGRQRKTMTWATSSGSETRPSRLERGPDFTA